MNLSAENEQKITELNDLLDNSFDEKDERRRTLFELRKVPDSDKSRRANVEYMQLMRDLEGTDYLEYVKTKCEINMRLILRKIMAGSPLEVLEKKFIQDYFFYTESNVFAGSLGNHKFADICHEAEHGSGEYNEQEIDLLKRSMN